MLARNFERPRLGWGYLAAVVVAMGGLAMVGGCGGSSTGPVEILNVSYDPTRELYKDYDEEFTRYWKETTGQDVKVSMSHGGAGKQARAVIDGQKADVVTLALAYDIDAMHEQAKLIPADWQKRLAHNSCPYTSTIVFLVRKGNPKGIHDWNDLVRPDIKVITPDPKTSGGARWNYLAAWGYVLKKELGDLAKLKDPKEAAAVAKAHEAAKEFVTKLLANVPQLDSGARGSTMTFVQRKMGDVLLAWENEAFLAIKELGPNEFDLVVPSISILAEPPVTVIDKVVDERGTRKVAEAYLEHLYSAEGQTIAAKHYYRPISPDLVPKEELARFPKVELFTIDDVFGGWQKAQKEHFNDGGTFDQIYKLKK